MASIIALGLVMSGCAAAGTSADDAATSSATTLVAAITTTTTTAQPADPTTTIPSEGTKELDVLAAAIEAGAGITSARMEGSIEISGVDVSEFGVSELVFSFGSSFDVGTGDLAFLFDMSDLADALTSNPPDPEDPLAGFATGLIGTIEFRQVGDRAFMRFGAFNDLLGVDTEWVSMPAEQAATFSGDLGTVPTDPNDVLDLYDGGTSTVEDLGAEAVNGVTATHYRVTIDTSAMITQMAPDERAEFENSGVYAEGVVPFDLWITSAGYVVRMVLEIDGTTIDAPPGEQFDAVRVRYDVFDINEPVVVEAPPPSEVTKIEDLGDVFGFDLTET